LFSCEGGFEEPLFSYEDLGFEGGRKSLQDR
jgi:hypothetical protein